MTDVVEKAINGLAPEPIALPAMLTWRYDGVGVVDDDEYECNNAPGD